MIDTTDDEAQMRRALRLAARGRGRTHPNPRVGAVVTRDGEIVGEGYHRGPGHPHAEVVAMAAADQKARGAVLYTTLEPCSHKDKRTPPCVDAILKHGIRRVVAAMVDPNPAVSGAGLHRLRASGVVVEVGVCQREAMRLNAAYVKWITTGRPYVVLKAAMTLDGQIATASGVPRWITGEAARLDGRRLRAAADAVLVGVGTVVADNPQLTTRIRGARDPLRVVIDPSLRTPLSADVIATAQKTPTLILATRRRASVKKAMQMTARGVEVCYLPETDGEIPFISVLNLLGKRGILSLLVEGGAGVNGSVLRSRDVDQVVFYVAPKLYGKAGGLGLFRDAGMTDGMTLEEVAIKKIGPDLRISGRVAMAGALSPRSYLIPDPSSRERREPRGEKNIRGQGEEGEGE